MTSMGSTFAPRKKYLTKTEKSAKGVEKGEVYERTLFTAKNKLFKQEDFVDEVKHFYTDLINLLVKDDKENGRYHRQLRIRAEGEDKVFFKKGRKY